jgi:hypothetical protein
MEQGAIERVSSKAESSYSKLPFMTIHRLTEPSFESIMATFELPNFVLMMRQEQFTKWPQIGCFEPAFKLQIVH